MGSAIMTKARKRKAIRRQVRILKASDERNRELKELARFIVPTGLYEVRKDVFVSKDNTWTTGGGMPFTRILRGTTVLVLTAPELEEVPSPAWKNNKQVFHAKFQVLVHDELYLMRYFIGSSNTACSVAEDDLKKLQ